MRPPPGQPHPCTAYRLSSIVALALPLLLIACSTFNRPARVHSIALADLDGDDDFDAFVVIGHGGGEPYVHPDFILYNDGSAHFEESETFPDPWPGQIGTVADFTADGLPDLLMTIDGGAMAFYASQGADRLALSASPPGYGFLAAPAPTGVMQRRPAVADLNGDGFLDVLAAGCCGRLSAERPAGGGHLRPSSQVWLNDGRGNDHRSLSGSPRYLGHMGSNAAALADLDGDGDIDAFLANGRTLDASGNYHTDSPNTVWLNNGNGNFHDSGQQLGNGESISIALGDLNGDGFPDAIVGNEGPAEMWLNDGAAHFTMAPQALDDGPYQALHLVDLDGDGDLDLLADAGRDGGSRAEVWLNDGEASFGRGQRIHYNRDQALALGDVTGDNQPDLFIAGVRTYRIWSGGGNGRFTSGPQGTYR